MFYDLVPNKRSRATIIKLFESEYVLKRKNRLHDFIETLCLFSNHYENSSQSFTKMVYIYQLANILWYHRKMYAKILENFLKFYDDGPGLCVLSIRVFALTALMPENCCSYCTNAGKP